MDSEIESLGALEEGRKSFVANAGSMSVRLLARNKFEALLDIEFVLSLSTRRESPLD